ncbi:unannotated protein [freshwater metagenome]|uniref:Unannotated protein n=1 Tax=freshwater metagenome TaxID=449393 RepID=A0A6J7I9G5_9ZZZZ|nr:hypothetical protein [Actinomycetota bacterium]
MSRRGVLLAASCTALLLAGCGGDDDPATGGTSTATTGAATATGSGTATTGTTATATGTTGAGAAGPAGAPPAATPEQAAAVPDGLVPAAPADESDDAAVIADLRARLAKAPAAARRIGTARYAIDLSLSSGPVRGPGTADFRSGASRTTLTVGSGTGATEVDQYNDGTTSFTRSAGSPWSRETSPIPNAPGNSTGLLAGQLRIGRAGAQATVAGLPCRWAGGVVPLRDLLRAGGAADGPEVQALLRVARPDAVYPIGACVSEDGLLAALRYDVAFDRDLGLPGAAGRERFRGSITFRDFGSAPAPERPSGLPTG